MANRINYPDVFCHSCGKPVTRRQIKSARNGGRLRSGYIYCSVKCHQRAIKKQRQGSVLEPETVQERRDYDELILKRRLKLREQELELIRSQSPEDEDPETEKRMRALLAPNPPAFIYASTGTPNGL